MLILPASVRLFPFAIVSRPPAFAAAVHRLLRPWLRVRVRNPMASPR